MVKHAAGLARWNIECEEYLSCLSRLLSGLERGENKDLKEKKISLTSNIHVLLHLFQ